jgi:hypothetical protein
VLASTAAAAWLLLAPTPARAAPVPEYQVFEVPSPQPQEGGFFGERMRSLGDVDRDGVGDVLISSSRFTAAGDHGGDIARAGRVYVVSGQTRSLLYTVDPPAPQEGASFGFWDANLGSDVNDDGIDDFVVSAPGQVIEGETVGQVYVLSGADGTLVHTHQPAGGLRRDRTLRRRLRRERHCPGDLNDDGIGGLVVSASGAFAGRGAAYAFNVPLQGDQPI